MVVFSPQHKILDGKVASVARREGPAAGRYRSGIRANVEWERNHIDLTCVEDNDWNKWKQARLCIGLD